MTLNIEPMNTPKTRAEFELRFHHLTEALNNDRMHIPSNMDDSIFRLRKLPNGRLDFLSVDAAARLNANMMLMMPRFHDF